MNFEVLHTGYCSIVLWQTPAGLAKFLAMSGAGDFGSPLRKFKLVFLGEQSGKQRQMKLFVVLYYSFVIFIVSSVTFRNTKFPQQSLYALITLRMFV